jgi:hypothetical protein
VHMGQCAGVPTNSASDAELLRDELARAQSENAQLVARLGALAQQLSAERSLEPSVASRAFQTSKRDDERVFEGRLATAVREAAEVVATPLARTVLHGGRSDKRLHCRRRRTSQRSRSSFRGCRPPSTTIRP